MTATVTPPPPTEALLGTGARIALGEHVVVMGEARFDLLLIGRVCGYGMDCHGRAFVNVEWTAGNEHKVTVEYLGTP